MHNEYITHTQQRLQEIKQRIDANQKEREELEKMQEHYLYVLRKEEEYTRYIQAKPIEVVRVTQVKRAGGGRKSTLDARVIAALRDAGGEMFVAELKPKFADAPQPTLFSCLKRLVEAGKLERDRPPNFMDVKRGMTVYKLRHL